MKKIPQRFTALTALVMVFLTVGCVSLSSPRGADVWARRTLKRLTLRQRIAQTMITGMNMRFVNSGNQHWQDLQQLLRTDGIGGIHIWYGEVNSALMYINEMQDLSKVPILFDADIEKGLGQRYRGGTVLPPLMALAATGNPDNAYQAGRIAAIEGRAVGINLNLSPVVDVNNNPANPIINVRAFGDDPELVSQHATAFIRGLQDNGMAATAKHFPGHGDTETDSHSFLATIPSDSSRLWEIELLPFARVIEAGVDLVMTAHIQAPDYQPHAGTPATLSRFWQQDILRGRLGFEGVIITDAMAMGGIRENYSPAYALITAIQAGADMVILDLPAKESIDIVERAVLKGLLSRERIDEAALRVLQLKAKIQPPQRRYLTTSETGRNLGRPGFRATADEIAAQAITVVKNSNGQIPLR